MILRTGVSMAAALLFLAGCTREIPAGALVVTQAPVTASADGATVLDLRYPRGSRVVVVAPPFRPDSVRDLSAGFFAAGDPCLSWDGRFVYFAGKQSAEAEWQIFKVSVGGGTSERQTQVPGGAMDPAVAAHAELVFSSPVPKRATSPTDARVAIYGQWPGESPRRFTFGPDSATSATVLRDGRILFVMARPRDDRLAPRQLGLFSMNNDGTEISAYACQGDGAPAIRRPRELADGRIAFLAATTDEVPAPTRAECVRAAAPFVTREKLFAFDSGPCRSIELDAGIDRLVCGEVREVAAGVASVHTAVYRVAPGSDGPGTPIFDDPHWNSIEAIAVQTRSEPAGHTTAIMPAATTGTILCLDVNDSASPAADGSVARAAKLRIVTQTTTGELLELGTVPVAADGSVLVRLPAKVALGFDTLDDAGRVLRHQPPIVWLQPGENRGCVGCHERRNHAPKNARPLATQTPPANLEFPAKTRAAGAAAP